MLGKNAKAKETAKSCKKEVNLCTLWQLQVTGALLRNGTSLGAAHLQQKAAVMVAVMSEPL